MSSRRRVSTALLGLLALVIAVWLGEDGLSADSAGSAGSAQPDRVASAPVVDSSDTAALSELPAEVTEVWHLIVQGGPFPYEQDGTTFGNREGLLPDRDRGYYREYTVPTPGEDERGARRLVAGDGSELYYTADHYDSFVAVDPGR